MKLQEFIQETKQDADRFDKMWSERCQKDPENWPLEMDGGEWFEQLLAFITTPELFQHEGK